MALAKRIAKVAAVKTRFDQAPALNEIQEKLFDSIQFSFS
jgi:hypothetical protein